jgi:cold shock CspA family protein
MKGFVKFYDDKKKFFGFITSDLDGREFYFNNTDTLNPVMTGDRVSFEGTENMKGYRAKKIQKIPKDDS